MRPRSSSENYVRFAVHSHCCRWSRVSERVVAAASLNTLQVLRVHDDGATKLASLDGSAAALTWHAVSSTLVAAMGCRLVVLSIGV